MNHVATLHFIEEKLNTSDVARLVPLLARNF